MNDEKRKSITPKDIAALSKQQRHVLGCICINQDGGHARSTLDSLEKRGLIASWDEDAGGHPPMTIKRYGAPFDVHMAWCQWCSEQPEEDL
jgi:hypothetical protein